MYAMRRVAAARRVRLALSEVFDSPARNAIDTLEVGHVSIINRDVRRRKEAYANVGVVAVLVEYS